MRRRSGKNDCNKTGDTLAIEPAWRSAERIKKIQTSSRTRPAMERYLLICVTFLAIFLFCPGIVTAGAPTVTISDYHVNPAVLMPGETGTISFTLTTTDQSARQSQSTGATAGNSFANTESTAINVHIYNVHVEGNGIIVQTADFDRVGDLGPGQSLPLTVLFRAPDREGIYFPEIWIDTGTGIGSGVSTRYPVPVNVNTRISLSKQPDLSLQKDIPVSVVPGDDFTCNLTLRNGGEGRADDILVALNMSVPPVSLASPANYHIDSLEPGGSAVFKLRFGSDKNRALGISTIPVQVSYANAEGTKKTLSESIGIPFRGKAAMAIKSIASDPALPEPGKPFTLIIRIENTGTDRATSVRTGLATAIDGAKEIFIGSIDKNSDAPAVFHLTSREGGEIPVTITISYTDDYGVHTVTQDTRFAVSPAGSPLLPVAVIALAAGAGIAYWYLRIRKRGDHA